MIKSVIYTILLFFSFNAIAQESLDHLLGTYNTRSIPYISVAELRMQQSDIEVLDTRELEEFQVSHIAWATHVGFDTFSIENVSELIKDKNTPIVVYCSLGIRSEEVGEKLKKAGYSNVKNLYGGIFQWKNKGYPILNSKEKETDSIHTFSKAWSKWLNEGIKVYKQSSNEE